MPIGSSTVVYVRAEDLFQSRNPGPFIERDLSSGSYDPTALADPTANRLNLHLGLARTGLDDRLSITNVLNSQPTLQREPDATGSSLYYAYTFRPRTLAFTATQRF